MTPARAQLAQTALVSAISIVALMLLALVLAYWTWAWMAPRPEPRLQASLQASTRLSAAGTLFGVVQQGRDANVVTGLAISLLGVVAGVGGEQGYALIRLDANKTVSVPAGADIAPGIRLVQVHADHVIVERNGLREILAWPERGNSALPLTPDAGK